MGLDLSTVANDLLLDLCDSDDYVIVYETGGIEDPDTGQWTPGVEVEQPLDSALEDTTSFGLIDSVNIQSGDIFLTVPPKVNIPTETYWFKVRGRSYTIVEHLPFTNAGVIQYHEFQLRSS